MRSVIGPLIGVVRHVVDGDTFDIEEDGSPVLQRVRIAGNYTPEAGSFAAVLAASILRRQLLGRNVRCEVLGRDTLGQFLCTVEMMREREVLVGRLGGGELRVSEARV